MVTKNKKEWFKDLKLVFFGALPFLIIFFWYEKIRQEAGMSFGGRDLKDTFFNLTHVPLGVFFEGLHGQLFSPGRSIFLYSPILLIPVLLGTSKKGEQIHVCDERFGQEVLG